MQIQVYFDATVKCLMALCLLVILPPNIALSAEEDICPAYDDFSLPKSLTLCSERLPLENRRIWEMLDREFIISVWRRSQALLWLKRAPRYFPYIEKKLDEAHMPDDLKYLAVAESNLLTYARSRKGAVGLWQFMPGTAKRHGLRVDSQVDERRNFETSTEGAIRYLRFLKDMFGTWTLALAAYNCGEQLLERKIEVQKVRDYFRLDLPLETERFIFRIAAIKIITETPGRYGFNLASENMYRPMNYETVSVNMDTPLRIKDVAQAMNTDFKTIKELNPHILGLHLPKGDITLHVPSGFAPKLAPILRQLSRIANLGKNGVSCCYALVKPGDTLHQIAKRTGVSVPELQKFNKISGSLIKVGQKLRLVP
jgi:hypothetical protein